MIKVLLLFSLFSVKAYSQETNSSISSKVNVTKDFNYYFKPKTTLEQTKWNHQRDLHANELRRRAEVNVQQYNQTVETRNQFVNTAKQQHLDLQKLESTYKPFEKGQGPKAYEAQGRRLQLQQTLNTISTLESEIKTKLESARRSTVKFVDFVNKTKIATTTAEQMRLMQSPMGRSMVVYANNPGVSSMYERIRGTNIGSGISSLPKGLTESGSLKTLNNIQVQYRATETIFIRSYDGGIMKGTILGASPSGELIIKEIAASGSQALKQSEYRKIDPNKVSTIQIIRPSANVSLETLNDVIKFRNVGGRFYDINPSQIGEIRAIKNYLGRPPALNSNTGNQAPVNPARPTGIR